MSGLLDSAYNTSQTGAQRVTGCAGFAAFSAIDWRRIVRDLVHVNVFRRMLMRNNRTSPYLWSSTLLTGMPAVEKWPRKFEHR